MTFIIYQTQPTFPATDQNPNCVRYQVGSLWIDSDAGRPPTQSEIDAVLSPPAQQRAATFLADKDLRDFRALIAAATSPADLKAKVAVLTAQQKQNLVLAFMIDYVASGRG